MVDPTDQREFLEVCRAAACPLGHVVHLAGIGSDVASRDDAAAVTDGESASLSSRRESPGPPQGKRLQPSRPKEPTDRGGCSHQRPGEIGCAEQHAGCDIAEGVSPGDDPTRQEMVRGSHTETAGEVG